MSLARSDPYARIEHLEAENAWLKEQLVAEVVGEHFAKLRAHGLSVQASRMILTLYGRRGRVMSRDALCDAIPPVDSAHERDGESIVNAYVCKVRKLLGRDVIESVRGAGYRITPAGTAKVRGILGDLAP